MPSNPLLAGLMNSAPSPQMPGAPPPGPQGPPMGGGGQPPPASGDPIAQATMQLQQVMAELKGILQLLMSLGMPQSPPPMNPMGM